MFKRYIILLASICSLASCTKVIDIDYESIDQLYVIEAELSQEGGTLIITQSSDMDKPIQNTPITTAEVVAVSEKGEEFHFSTDENGVYRTSSPLNLETGLDYSLSVKIDDKTFTSTSHLYPAPSVGNIVVSTQQLSPGISLSFCTFNILNTIGELNYYLYRCRSFGNEKENGTEPKWALAIERIEGDPIMLMAQLSSEEYDLEDGDEITIEVKAIDRATYDYLYSLNLSGDSSSNPANNFEGGCLGYFSASSLTTISTQFCSTNVK